ncbi:hypothetical protein ACFQZ4_25990 [Catellatospora coxensis]
MSAATPLEIESLEELSERLAEKSLAGLTVQGLTIGADLSRIKVKDAVFIGCTFPSLAAEAALVRRGAHVVPVADWVPYPTHPARLYTAADLTAGFAENGFAGMYDTRVYEHFVAEGGPNAGSARRSRSVCTTTASTTPCMTPWPPSRPGGASASWAATRRCAAAARTAWRRRSATRWPATAGWC